MKRKMDEIIRAKTTSTSKMKPYIGYQFPITNPSLIRSRKKDLRFRSEGVDLKIEVSKFTTNYDQIKPKIVEILHNLEVQYCEKCSGIMRVIHYEITKRSGKKDEIYLCDDCALTKPDGVILIPIVEDFEE